jgi:hypothetical protein
MKKLGRKNVGRGISGKLCDTCRIGNEDLGINMGGKSGEGIGELVG